MGYIYSTDWRMKSLPTSRSWKIGFTIFKDKIKLYWSLWQKRFSKSGYKTQQGKTKPQ